MQRLAFGSFVSFLCTVVGRQSLSLRFEVICAEAAVRIFFRLRPAIDNRLSCFSILVRKTFRSRFRRLRRIAAGGAVRASPLQSSECTPTKAGDAAANRVERAADELVFYRCGTVRGETLKTFIKMENQILNPNANAEAALTLADGEVILSLSIYPEIDPETGFGSAMNADRREFDMVAELTIRRADGTTYTKEPDDVIYYTTDSFVSISGKRVIVEELPAQAIDRFFYIKAILPTGGITTQCRCYQYNNLQYAKIGTRVVPSLSGSIYEPGVYECCVCDKDGNKFGTAGSIPSITVVSGSITVLGNGRIKIEKGTNAEIRIVAVYPGRPVAFLQVGGK